MPGKINFQDKEEIKMETANCLDLHENESTPYQNP